MKNLATFKNEIILIAGSGSFAYESANYLDKLNILNKIYLISENKLISKKFKNLVFNFDIKYLEKLIKDIKKGKVRDLLIIGYVKLPAIKDIKLSFLSKMYLTNDFYFNNINEQSLILKNFLNKKGLNLLSQKIIFKDYLPNKNDQYFKKDHIQMINNIKKNSKNFKKVFTLNMAQSLIMNGNRILSYEDIFGTDNMINRIGKKNSEFKNLIFIKSKKNNQLDEIDYPIIGLNTLNLLKKYNFKIICLFEANIIISEKKVFLDFIKKSNMSLLVL